MMASEILNDQPLQSGARRSAFARRAFCTNRSRRPSTAKRTIVAVAIGLIVWPGLLLADNEKYAAEDALIDGTFSALEASGVSPIPSEELNDATPLLKCVAHGDSNVGDCAKKAAVEAVLGSDAGDAAPVVECVLDGKPVQSCAIDAAVSQLPSQAGDLVKCALNASSQQDIVGCAAKTATSGLPPEVGDVAQCLLKPGADPTQCAVSAAGGQLPPQVQAIMPCLKDPATVQACAQKQVLSSLPPGAQSVATCILSQRSNPDPSAALNCAAQSAGPDMKKKLADIQKATDPNSEIFRLFNDIQNQDWKDMSLILGEEAYKVAACATLKAILAPGPHTDFLCKDSDILISMGVDAARALVQQAKDGDFGGMLGTLAKFGMTGPQCAFAKAISDDVYNVVCTNLGKIIDAGADSPYVIGYLGGIFTVNPILGAIIGIAWSKIIKSDKCHKPENYFAEHYLNCQHYSVLLAQTDPQALTKFTDPITAECLGYYEDCLSKDDAHKICSALISEFNQEVTTIKNAYQSMAQQEAQSFKTKFENDRSNICADKDVDINNSTAGADFESACQVMLNNFQPLPSPADASCKNPSSKPPGSIFDNRPSAQKTACGQAAQTSLKKVINDVCAGAGVCFPVNQCTDCDIDVR